MTLCSLSAIGLTVIMMVVNYLGNQATGTLVVPGSVTFKQRWSDLLATGSSQYRTLISNIENAIQQEFQHDGSLRNATVTQLRADQATKKSASRGYLTADFKLYLWNTSVTGLKRLRDAVLKGKLGSIPVRRHSLHLKEMMYWKSDIPHAYSMWPSGTYGLPKPIAGCHGDKWREGFRYHDTENHYNRNNQSVNSHLSGKVTLHGIRQEFCMHMDEERTGSSEDRPWPEGQYCVYKKGPSCPAGLEEGWIRWDDENSNIDYPNSSGGELPEGIYDDNTVIYYCCDSRGDKDTAIWLPSGRPFYLLAYRSKGCQKVYRYQVSSEFLHFDDEDRANVNLHSAVAPYGVNEDLYNTRIYYCYYTPVSCVNENQDDLTCLTFQPSSHDGVSKMAVTSSKEPDDSKRRKAFAMGSGVGLLLMGTTAFCVMMKRFVTRSAMVYYY